jgi:hypothetical protein
MLKSYSYYMLQALSGSATRTIVFVGEKHFKKQSLVTNYLSETYLF